MSSWKKINGVEGLYQNQNGVYYVRLTRPKKTFLSLETDKVKVAKKKIRQLDTRNKIQNASNQKHLCMKDLVTLFIEEELNTLQVKPKTKIGIKQGLLHIKNVPSLWTANLDNMSSKRIRSGIDKLGKLSNASKNYAVYGINKVIDFAEEKGLFSEGKLTKVRGFKTTARQLVLPNRQQFDELVASLKYPIERTYRKTKLPLGWEKMSRQDLMIKMSVSKATLNRRIAETKEKSGYKKIGRPETAFTFLLLCYTGLRLGEARKLEWKDIEDDRIIIHGTKTTSAFRFLPLYPQLRNLLNSIATHRGQIKPNDKVMGRQRIDKALRRACQKVGIQNLRHHDLRHYFATKVVQAGVDMPTIAKWLGHSDGGALAMKVYSNVMDEHILKSANKLGRSFDF
jgi:integrase